MAAAARARRLAAPVGRPLRRAAVSLRTRRWPPFSRLFLVEDAPGWVLAYEARQVGRLAESLGAALGPRAWARAVRRQAVFYLSHFDLLLGGRWETGNRIGVSYFHGRPGTPGMPEFDACFEALRRHHQAIDRVQVTCRAMEELVRESGIAPVKVHRIPIGVDLDAFPLVSEAERAAARRRLGLPREAFVVGSLQKDGVGFGEGREPKLIKGPDVLLAALERLRGRVPGLVVLLTGPARGYVKAGLERLRIPYRHVLLPNVEAVASAYAALDVCLVTSREEGGPRAALEAMASGVPLVTTRVGQAADLVRHGENGWLAEVGDAGALAAWVEHVAAAPAAELAAVRAAGRATAEANAYPALRPRWRRLLQGFVALPAEG